MRGGIPAASRRGQIEGADGSRTRLVARNGIRFPVTPRKCQPPTAITEYEWKSGRGLNPYLRFFTSDVPRRCYALLLLSTAL